MPIQRFVWGQIAPYWCWIWVTGFWSMHMSYRLHFVNSDRAANTFDVCVGSRDYLGGIRTWTKPWITDRPG
jgi:hypothetical protein